MRIEVLCVCRQVPRWVTSAVQEYCKRLPHSFELSFSQVSPARGKVGKTKRRSEEALRLRKRINKSSPWIALEVSGISLDSLSLARELQKFREQYGQLILVIGGVDGLSPELVKEATARWSLSSLTLPHALVQVVVAEQVYRTWSILERHPYNR